jgi:hypothetical protein
MIYKYKLQKNIFLRPTGAVDLLLNCSLLFLTNLKCKPGIESCMASIILKRDRDTSRQNTGWLTLNELKKD